jgi:ABC-type amino acid transport substrate-binding protein
MINPIGFFYSGGQPMGVNYETLRDFESFASKKLKTGTIKVKVTFIPVRPEELEAALTEGKGDVGAHALVITPERQERVAFTTPLEKGVKQVIVSGANFVQVSGFQESAAPVGSTVGKSWTNSRRNLTIRNTWNVIRGSVAPTTPPAAKDADRFSLVDRRAKTYAQARGRSVVAARESGRWSVVPVSVERAIPIQLAPKLYVVRRIQKN